MIVVGVTGSLATGKSFVAGILKSLGADVLDADRIAHRAIRKKSAQYRKAAAAFGRKILSDDGEIDRKALAGAVFSDEKKLRRLVKIVHPSVIKEIKRRLRIVSLRRRRSIVVIDAPLLIESGLLDEVDILIVVTSTRATQLARAGRGLKLDKKDAVRRIRRQMPLAEKAKRADLIIDNDGSMARTKKQVVKVWKILKRLDLK
ncbi:MAG: dephospho-CoA kinase [Candidatus Omnitrophota bacterium]